jgi:hypothetical protein
MAKTVARKSDTRLEAITRTVVVRGIKPLMFDRYPGDNQTKLEWHQKIYLVPGTNVLCFPTANMVSFFTSHNTNSAPKRLRDPRQFKKICNAILSFMDVAAPDGSEYAPITRNGKPILLGVPADGEDKSSGLRLHRSVARLDKGIPNPKERALLPLPWEIEFRFSITPNKEIKEQEIKNLLEEGGIAIGLGTFRGVYGKFVVDRWD